MPLYQICFSALSPVMPLGQYLVQVIQRLCHGPLIGPFILLNTARIIYYYSSRHCEIILDVSRSFIIVLAIARNFIIVLVVASNFLLFFSSLRDYSPQLRGILLSLQELCSDSFSRCYEGVYLRFHSTLRGITGLGFAVQVNPVNL